ncbi:MAG: hypothetical protein NTX01_03015 [Candidatus Omnitrophica bacterium]|nr:hypothetical protein [Candidatus Omnitrophota bacterium]
MDKKEEKKKSWFRKHPILTVILIMILIPAIGGFFTGLRENNTPNNVNPSTVAKNNPCPELSNAKLLSYNSLMQSWSVEVPPYKTANEEVVYSTALKTTKNDSIIYCNVGSEEGQNANWIYCGDTLSPITLNILDSQGTITKKIAVQVILDKNSKNYVKTVCDAYLI